MRRFAFMATVFLMAGAFSFAETWTGRLVDAACKAKYEGSDSPAANCAATRETHLFGIELADARVLDLDAAGNEKADDAIKRVQKKDLHATVTGVLRGQMVKVVAIQVQ